MQSANSSLKQRVVTAMVLIPLVVAAILWLPTPLFAGVLALFVALGALEWARLAGLSSPFRWLYAVVLLFALLPVWWLSAFPFAIRILLWMSLGWWILAAVWIFRYPASATAWSGSAWRRCLIGFLILVPPWAALVVLHGHGEQGPWLILLLMLLIWGADSGAYFVGRKWGKDKLAPRVSPGKSRQGLWGGLITAAVVALLFGRLFPIHVEYEIYFIAVCIIVAMFSVLGDLVESMFKRDAGVKDSGTLLPGHGGVLDRIDSLTAAAPVFALATLGVCL